MGWIDNYWISWRYHLHGWHTPDVPHLKGFTHWQWVIQANQRNIIPFPILNTAPETTVGILHIFGTIEWGCLILGDGIGKKNHIWFFMCFSSSTCKNHQPLQPEPACTHTPEAWQPWMLANRSRAACSWSLKPVKPVAEKSNHPQNVGIEMMWLHWYIYIHIFIFTYT